MSNKIGPEGMGLYQLIVMIYFFLATATTSGVNLLVTRMVTDNIACGNLKKIQHIMNICVFISLFLSSVAAIILYFSSEFTSNYFLRDSRAILSLKLLAPSLPFMALSSCYRGYFMAVRKAGYAASEQLVEQVIEIAVFAFLINSFASKGVEYACAAVVIGTTFAEIISFVYSYILYKTNLKKLLRKTNTKNTKNIRFIKNFISIWFPTTGNACLRSGLSTVENIMIPKGLKRSGASYQSSLSAYGILSAMVMPVITFPSAFLMSFSTLLIPEFSEANAKGNKLSIKNISYKVFAISFYFSILISGLFIAYGKELGLILYNNETVGYYIGLLAPILPLMYLDSIVDAMLKGLNEQMCYFTYNIIDSVIRIILIFILLPRMGIAGVIVIIFASEILNSSFSIAKLMKLTELKIEIKQWILKPILAISLPCICLYLLNSSLCYILTDNLHRLLFKMIISIIIYLLLIFMMGCINIKTSKKFIIWLPILKKLSY